MAVDVAAEVVDVLPGVFRGIDLLGVLLNGVLGGAIARRKRFDLVGFAVLAIVSALGGGMLRDTLLQAGPPVALTDPYYLGTALVGAFIAFLLPLQGRWWDRLFVLADGVVLGCWAATGATKALAAGLGVLPAILLGVTTAVGGGMIRDIVVGEVPAILGGNTLYATSAVFAGVAMIALSEAGHETVGMVVATVVGAGLSILAHRRRWVLPDAEAVHLQALWRPGRRRDERAGEDSGTRLDRWWRRRHPRRRR